MIPSIGRIVHLHLSASCAEQINKRRSDAHVSAAALGANGTQRHTGNPVSEGDIFPMIICKVWATEPTESTSVNGQAFLDGSDSLWVTSVTQGTEPGHFSDPRGGS